MVLCDNYSSFSLVENTAIRFLNEWVFQILKDPKKDANYRQDVDELWAEVDARFNRGREEAKKIPEKTLKVRSMFLLYWSVILCHFPYAANNPIFIRTAADTYCILKETG